jgi:hypothetical protein
VAAAANLNVRSLRYPCSRQPPPPSPASRVFSPPRGWAAPRSPCRAELPLQKSPNIRPPATQVSRYFGASTSTTPEACAVSRSGAP